MSASRRRWALPVVLVAVAAAFGTTGYFVGSAAGPGTPVEPTPTPTIAAAVSGIVVDENGDAIVSSIEVEDLGDSTRHRYQTDMLGRYDFTLDAGEYLLRYTKGYEFGVVERTVVVDDRLRRALEPVVLEADVDMRAAGWYGGDLHQHSRYDEAQQSVAEILVSNLANGLHWGALTDHNTVAGLEEWARAGDLLAAGPDRFVAVPGLEVTTDRGHVIVLDPAELIDHSTDAGRDDMQRIIDEAKAGGSVIQLNHPHLIEPMGFADWDLHPQFDLLEVWNGKAPPPTTGPNLQSKESWYELLSSGVFLPATADSDNHDIDGGFAWARGASNEEDEWMVRGLFSGDPRTYVHAPDGTKAGIIDALTAGHSFLTNGPLPRFTLGGAIPGETIGAGTVRLELEAFDRRGLDRAVVIENGVALEEFALSGTSDSLESVDLPVSSGSWYLIELYGADGGYALTNPVFVR